MRAMRARGFNGYGDLKLANHPVHQVLIEQFWRW
jgi:hypothetical protein